MGNGDRGQSEGLGQGSDWPDERAGKISAGAVPPALLATADEVIE